MSLFRINNLRTLKQLTSLTRPSNVSNKPGASAPCSKSFSQGNDGKQQNDSQQQNDQQQNQMQEQMQMQVPQPATFNQQCFPQQQWCPCCCQPSACYIPPGQNIPACNPFCPSPQMQMQMQSPMNAQMNAQMSSPQYTQPQQFMPQQFMPMQAHCMPNWNPVMDSGASGYPCQFPAQDSRMCSTFCPECRGPCGPNEQCPRCQAQRMASNEVSDQQRSDEKRERSNMSSGSAYTDLFEKKKNPSKTDN